MLAEPTNHRRSTSPLSAVMKTESRRLEHREAFPAPFCRSTMTGRGTAMLCRIAHNPPQLGRLVELRFDGQTEVSNSDQLLFTMTACVGPSPKEKYLRKNALVKVRMNGDSQRFSPVLFCATPATWRGKEIPIGGILFKLSLSGQSR
jgi:hypothetical protein